MNPLPTMKQIRELHRQNAAWPAELKDVPPPWPDVPFDVSTGSIPVRVMRSRKFLLVVWDQQGTTRLSAMRTDYDLETRHPRELITWDDLQRLKGEAGFGLECAVEIFPPAGRVVNVANMRHLFITPAPEFMW